MNYEKSRQNSPRFQSLTSLTVREFDELLPYFEANWLHFIERYNLDGTPRLRSYSPRNESQLPTVLHKLFFILLYQKNNTLQEFLAASFDLDTGMANKWTVRRSDTRIIPYFRKISCYIQHSYQSTRY